MTLQDLFSQGKLGEALAEQVATVRARPTEVDARWELVVLLCFAGELDRALAQLDALVQLEPASAVGASVYRSLIQAEAERWVVQCRTGRPLLPSQPCAHLEARLDALCALRSGDAEAAQAALERAEALRPELEGKLNGDLFDGLADSDDLLAPLLEVYAGGRYLWLGFEHVRRLEIGAPAQRIDLLWPRATLQIADSAEEMHVHIPALYAGSADAEAEPLRLGRMTEWVPQQDLIERGLGQRVLWIQRGEQRSELPLLELRSLEITGGAAEGERRG